LVAVLFANVCSSIAKVDITPSVTVMEEYNDNLFLTDSAKEFDYTTKVSPNILLEYSPSSSLDLSLDYRLDFRFYSRNSRFNDTDLKDTQNVNLSAQARPMNRVFIDLSDNYRRVPVDVRRKTAVDNVIRNMTDNNVFMVSPYAILPLSSTLSTTLGYKYINTWFDSKENTDSESHTAFLALTNKFSSALSLALRYDYCKYLPSEQRTVKLFEDYDKHSGSIGLTYQIGPSLAVNGQVGKSYLKFETGNNRQNTFWNFNVDYNMKESTSLGAGYSTMFNDSSTSGVYKSQRYDMYFKTGTKVKLSINPYHSHDEYLSSDDREDRIFGIIANLDFPVTSQMDLLLDGLLERQKFLPGDEKVCKYSIGTTVNYKLSSKITSGIGYRFNNSNSNIDSEDYKNNIVWLQAKVVF
jgi:hypothetical protein